MSDNTKTTGRTDEEQRAEATVVANTAAEARMARSTPTPTQAENDLIRVGALDIDDKQADGSGPDRPMPEPTTPQPRAIGADTPAGGYRTRAAAPAPPTAPASPGPTTSGGKAE